MVMMSPVIAPMVVSLISLPDRHVVDVVGVVEAADARGVVPLAVIRPVVLEIVGRVRGMVVRTRPQEIHLMVRSEVIEAMRVLTGSEVSLQSQTIRPRLSVVTHGINPVSLG